MKSQKIIRWILIAAIFISLWELFSLKSNNPKLFPDIYHLFTTTFPSIGVFDGGQASYLAALKVLLTNSFITFLRLLVGISLGIVLGLMNGLMIHYFSTFKRGNLMILKFLRSIPLLALIPLFLYWFGGREFGIILYIIFGGVIIIGSNTYDAVLNVPLPYIENAKILGAHKTKIYRSIILVAILPEIYGGLKNLIGLSWAISLAAEYLSSSNGLGFLTSQSYSNGDMGKLLILCLVYIILGMLSFTILKFLFSKLIIWQ
ncbi:MAG TPA: ABC transporter permease subunit [Chitinophagales bacterium]|nr:ABC transporter permease subunit [Chitinophagales bacterium]